MSNHGAIAKQILTCCEGSSYGGLVYLMDDLSVQVYSSQTSIHIVYAVDPFKPRPLKREIEAVIGLIEQSHGQCIAASPDYRLFVDVRALVIDVGISSGHMEVQIAHKSGGDLVFFVDLD